jgi:ADYC domain
VLALFDCGERRSAGVALLVSALLLGFGPSAAQYSGNVNPVVVEGTTLVVLRPDGVRVEGGALIGATVVGGSPELGQAAFRIVGIRPDPDDPEITLHDLTTRDPVTGEWKVYCAPDDRGVLGGLFLAGAWDATGKHVHDDKFSVSCTSGVIGKCVRAGYKPWKMASDGRPMWDYHQTCVRAVRADYCGNGTAHTREGMRIEIIDRLNPVALPDSGLAFEAGWTPEGASCLARPRLPTWSRDEIVAACPERLSRRVGELADCAMETELGKPDVLLVNKSATAP